MTADLLHLPRRLFSRVVPQRATVFGVALCVALASASAGAQSASGGATAQALFDSAKKLMKSGKYAEACPALEESQRIEPRSGTALNLADCYEHQGRLASAWSTYIEAATLAKSSGNSERERGARERADGLAPKLSKLSISAPSASSIPDLQVTRDGEPVGPAQYGVPLPADPGEHTVSARAPGRKAWQAKVTVEGSASTARVTVPDLEKEPLASGGAAGTEHPGEPVTPPPAVDAKPKHSKGAVIAGGVVTGVLVVGTVVTSILYKSKSSEYDTANNSGAGNSSDLRSQTRTLGVVNLALLGGAVVAAGVTVVLWATSSKEAPATARLSLRGTFSPELSGLTLGGSL